MVIIHIFERPAWTEQSKHSLDWNDYHQYPSWELDFLSYTTANTLIFLFLLVSWVGVGLELGYKRNTSNQYIPYTSVVILLIKSISIIANLVIISKHQTPTVSVSPIEGFLCLLVELQHNNNIGFFLRTIPKFALLVTGIAVFTSIYTTMGMLIFDPAEAESQQYFPNFGAALWNMLMVLSSSNWPGPMIPAIITNRLFVLYFYTFLVIVVWGLLNLVLGFNYLFFQTEQKIIYDMQEKTRQDNKTAAFRILDAENRGCLTYEQVDILLVEMYEYYESVHDIPTYEERYELILSLDVHNNNMIDERDFCSIEQKCFLGALKVNRAKRRKFLRFISANIIKEQSAQMIREQTEKIKHVTLQAGAAVGILPIVYTATDNVTTTHAADTTNTIYNTTNDTTNTTDAPTTRKNGHTRGVRFGDTEIIADTAVNPMYDASSIEEGRVNDPNTTVQDSNDNNNRADHDVHNSAPSSPTYNPLNLSDDVDEESRRSSRANLIERASQYAIKYVDPKVLEWYKSIGDSQIVALNRERGRSFHRFMSHVAMQVDSIYFDIFSDTVIAVVGIAVLVVEYRLGLTVAYNVLTLLEMLLKIAVKGSHRYACSTRNSLDWKIAISLLALTILDACLKPPNHTHVIMKTLVLLRTLLFPRNIFVTNGFKHFRYRQRIAFSYAFKSIDHLIFLLLVLVVMMYVFASIGQQLYGGTMSRDSQAVRDSIYGQKLYWPVNFNDMPSGMVTMFLLLSVNDMNVTAAGLVAALSQWAEVFITLWYCVGELFLLEILTSLFLSQYIAYLEHKSSVKRAAKEEEERRIEEERRESRKLEAPSGFDSFSDRLTPYSAISSPLHSRVFIHTERLSISGDEDYDDEDDEIGFPTPHQSSRLTKRFSWAASRRFSANLTANETDSSEPTEPPSGTPKLTKRFSWAASRRFSANISTDNAEVSDRSEPPSPQDAATAANTAQNQGFSASVLSGRLAGATTAAGALVVDTTAKASTTATDFMQTGTVKFNNLLKLLAVEDQEEVDRSDAMLGRPSGNVRFVSPVSSPREARCDSVSSSVSSRSARGAVMMPPRMGDPTSRRVFSSRIRSPDDRRESFASTTGSEVDVLDRLNNIRGEDEPSAPITLTAGFDKSIFSSDADRTRLNEWMIDKRKSTKVRRVAMMSSHSKHSSHHSSRSENGVSGFDPRSRKSSTASASDNRGRTTTGTWDVEGEAALSHIRARDHSSPTSGRSRTSTGADDALSGASPGEPERVARSLIHAFNVRKSSRSSVRADGDAVDKSGTDDQDSSPDKTRVDRAESCATDVEQGSTRSRGFSSLYQTDEEMEHFAPQSWYDWFYLENEVSPIEEAAALIQGAADGEDPELFTSRRGLWCYHKRIQYATLFKVCSVLYAFLKVFQRPMWTYHEPAWNNSTYFPVSGVPLMSPEATCALNIPLLLVMFYGVLLEVGHQDSGIVSMFQNLTKLRIMRNFLLMFCVVQFILVLYVLSGGPQKLATFSSSGGTLYIMWFGRRSLRKFRSVLQVLPRLSAVLAVYIVIICLFAGFGPFLYNMKDFGEDDDITGDYFTNFRTSTWSLLIAMSTSSYPDQVMSGYRAHREFSLFFFLFMTIGSIIMLNLILVVVFVQFQKASLLSADMQRAVRQVLLMESFDALDTEEKEYVDNNQVNGVINELYASYPAFKKAASPEGDVRSALMSSLDHDLDGRIYIEDYWYFVEIARATQKALPPKTFMELWFPEVVEHRLFQRIKRMVMFPYTNVIVDCLLAVFTISNLVANSGDLYAANPNSEGLAAVQVTVMLIEMGCKLAVRGWARYKRSFRNQLDCTVAVAAFIAVLGSAAYSGVSGFTLIRRVALMCRFFWLPRNVRYFFENKGMKRFAKMAWRIVGKTLTLGVVFVCILYAFASIGMFALGGLINRDPTSPHYQALVDSRYGANNYYPLNFNDFTSSVIVVFSCLYVSDFDVLSEGFVVTSTISARLYFVAWYVVGALLMLNIIKSYFLFEFLTVFSAATEEKCVEIESAVASTSSEEVIPEVAVRNPMMDSDKTLDENASDKSFATMKGVIFTETVNPLTFDMAGKYRPLPPLPTSSPPESPRASARHVALQDFALSDELESIDSVLLPPPLLVMPPPLPITPPPPVLTLDTLEDDEPSSMRRPARVPRRLHTPRPAHVESSSEDDDCSM